MRKLLGVMVFAGMVAASPALAKDPCPPIAAGPLPWTIDQVMSGDRYADVYLDIDSQGRPTGCRMGKNNIPGDDKYFVCSAFMAQWSTQPPPNAGKGGPTTVERKYFEYGMRHADAERAARKRFFREHPNERPECYPDAD